MRVQRFSSFEGIDRERFRSLLERRFSKNLVSDYFEYAKPNLVSIAMPDGSDCYAGAIVMENFSRDLWYLDKIVTAKEFNGTMLFIRLLKEAAGKGKIVFRSRPENPVNRIYAKMFNLTSYGGWRIYWKGMDLDARDEGIKYALGKKETMI